MTHKIGRYEIKHQIPGGGMAEVYLAYDPNAERQVIVKVIKREYCHDPEFKARFKREATTVAALEHAAIVPIYEFDEYEGQPFIAMRYMPGGSLLDRMRQGPPLTIAEIVQIVERIANALDEAHAHGVIHRDLKPGNILFDGRGQAYLADFGIAKQITEASAPQMTAGFIGTAAYASPEQIMGQTSLDGRTDIYSLGIIVFELLTGRLPYEAETPISQALAHIRKPVPDVAAFNPQLPPGCNGLIQKAMAKDCTQRYQTSGELAQALHATILPATQPASPVPLAPARPARRWLWFLPVPVMLAAGCGLAVLIAGLLALPSLLPQWMANPPLAAATATPGPGATRIAAADGMLQIYIPASEFRMGGALADEEKPERTVDLDAFWIDQTEVTTAMYAQFVKATGYQTQAEKKGYSMVYKPGSGSTSGVDDAYWAYPRGPAEEAAGLDYPVVQIAWDDAREYCEWAGRRLPTEAEWEKAARGTEGQEYPWGDQAVAGNLVNLADKNLTSSLNALMTREVDDGYAYAAPVGSYPEGASPYGALDLAGNVSEWVNDWFDPNYYPTAPDQNPPGPETPGDFNEKVLRGGDWGSGYTGVRAAARSYFFYDGAQDSFGFRCAQTP